MGTLWWTKYMKLCTMELLFFFLTFWKLWSSIYTERYTNKGSTWWVVAYVYTSVTRQRNRTIPKSQEVFHNSTQSTYLTYLPRDNHCFDSVLQFKRIRVIAVWTREVVYVEHLAHCLVQNHSTNTSYHCYVGSAYLFLDLNPARRGEM